MQEKNRQILIVFIKNPVRGKVKTRLAEVIGEDAALRVYSDLLLLTFKLCGQRAEDVIFYADTALSGSLFPKQLNFNYTLQQGKGLGEKMSKAIAEQLQEYQRVVLIGSDCPELTGSILDEAYAALDDHDVVLGPSVDGGYYLVGMKDLHEACFQDIAWGTHTVFDDTMERCAEDGLSVYRLPVLRDLDTHEDLQYFHDRSVL